VQDGAMSLESNDKLCFLNNFSRNAPIELQFLRVVFERLRIFLKFLKLKSVKVLLRFDRTKKWSAFDEMVKNLTP
jgi:hypothetical protein